MVGRNYDCLNSTCFKGTNTMIGTYLGHSVQWGCSAPNCSSQGKVSNLLYFCVRESKTTLDGPREKCFFFFVIGEDQDGNPDCACNLVWEKGEVHSPLSLREQLVGFSSRTYHCWQTCQLLNAQIFLT